jgi:hypothetical protein
MPDAEVFVQLYGENGTTKEVNLEKWLRDDFERGVTNSFKENLIR